MMPIDGQLRLEPLSARQVALCGMKYGLQITHPLLRGHVEAIAEAGQPTMKFTSVIRHDATKPAPTQWWLCLDEEDCRPWLAALTAARDARRQLNADVSRRQKAVVAPALAMLAGRYTAGAGSGSGSARGAAGGRFAGGLAARRAVQQRAQAASTAPQFGSGAVAAVPAFQEHLRARSASLFKKSTVAEFYELGHAIGEGAFAQVSSRPSALLRRDSASRDAILI